MKKIFYLKQLLVIVFNVLAFSVLAQINTNSITIETSSLNQKFERPVTWEVTYVDLKNSEGEIIYTAIIKPKWQMGFHNDQYRKPTLKSVTLSASKNFKLIGKVVTEEVVPQNDVKSSVLKTYLFENKAIFKQKIKRITKKSFKIKTTIEFTNYSGKLIEPGCLEELEVIIN